MSDPNAARRRLVLVVEDEPGIRETLTMLLEMEEFDVLAASNGLEALERLSAGGCDLIITDQMMPRMDGVTFLQKVRALDRFRHTPVILMSAVQRPPEAMRSLVDVFIGKPFEVSKLMRTIRALLETNGT